MPTGVYHRSEKEKTRLKDMLKTIGYKTPKGKRFSPSTEFKKGLIPWNKGKEWIEMRGENHPSRNPVHKLTFRRVWQQSKGILLKGILRGENHPQWKGGKTPLIMKLRNSPKYKEWRIAIFERDKFTCLICEDNRGGNLEAHHKNGMADIIHQNNIGSVEEAMNCDKLWDLKNGVTLCQNCHPLGNEISRILKILILP